MGFENSNGGLAQRLQYGEYFQIVEKQGGTRRFTPLRLVEAIFLHNSLKHKIPASFH